MLLAVLLAIVFGLLANAFDFTALNVYLKPISDIFLRLLKMIILPLVFCSIYLSIVNLGDVNKIGSLGKRTLLYYFTTTAIAVLIGLILVNLINPGQNFSNLKT